MTAGLGTAQPDAVDGGARPDDGAPKTGTIQCPTLAPCGIDCRMCSVFQRKRKPCAGCGGPDANKPAHCVNCATVLCPEKPAGAFCTACAGFPCRRLRQLDRRYREKHHYSPLAALALAREQGEGTLMADNDRRFTCPGCGGLVCLQKDNCQHCAASVDWTDR